MLTLESIQADEERVLKESNLKNLASALKQAEAQLKVIEHQKTWYLAHIEEIKKFATEGDLLLTRKVKELYEQKVPPYMPDTF